MCVHVDSLLGTSAYLKFADVLPLVCLASAHRTFVKHEYYGNMIVITLNLQSMSRKKKGKKNGKRIVTRPLLGKVL